MVSEQGICQNNESPRVKTKAQISTKKILNPQTVSRLYCLKLQVLRKKLFLNCNINIHRRWLFLHLVLIRNFCSSLKATAHNFCIFQHKNPEEVSLGMGKIKPWRAGSEKLNTSNLNFSHFNMFGSNVGWLSAILNPTSVPHQLAWHRQEPLTPQEGTVRNRSGEFMQHSRLRAWAKLFVLRLRFQNQSEFKPLVLQVRFQNRCLYVLLFYSSARSSTISL